MGPCLIWALHHCPVLISSGLGEVKEEEEEEEEGNAIVRIWEGLICAKKIRFEPPCRLARFLQLSHFRGNKI